MKTFAFLVSTALLLSSCAMNTDLAPGGRINQQVTLYKMNGTTRVEGAFSNVTPLTISAVTETAEAPFAEVRFYASLIKENNEDVAVNVALSPEAVASYNQVYKKDFLPVPSEWITLPSTLNIASGSVISNIGTIRVIAPSEMKANTPYMFAITIGDVSDGSIRPIETTRTLFYTVVKNTEVRIEKVLSIKRDEYLQIEGGTPIDDIGTTFTMEGLVYNERFRGPGEGDAGITTFMGTEGRILLRFGDAGVDPDHLQVSGQDIGKFQPKKWYHVAVVADDVEIVVYVNGRRAKNFRGLGGLEDFLIGRSWNDNRGMEGKLSEIRLWKKARTAPEIQESMYSVDKSNPDLYAYWKMDEAKDNKIEDVSGHGKNLVLMGQAGKTGVQNITIENQDGIDVDN